jgi:hypothetical protein
MSRINVGRVILGGIVAGIVGDVLGYLVDGMLLAPQWAAGMKALGRPEFTMSQIMAFNILGIAQGIFTIWLYAAIRPRYGAGPKTAVCAGLAAWVAVVLLPNLGFMWASGLYPNNLTVMTSIGGIFEFVLGALAGAALYHEGPESAAATA